MLLLNDYLLIRRVLVWVGMSFLSLSPCTLLVWVVLPSLTSCLGCHPYLYNKQPEKNHWDILSYTWIAKYMYLDSNTNLDTIWNEIIDDCFDDNIEEEILRVLREMQQDNNLTRRRRRRTIIDRRREEGHNWLFNDYFNENPIYKQAQFQQRFRMERYALRNCKSHWSSWWIF